MTSPQISALLSCKTFSLIKNVNQAKRQRSPLRLPRAGVAPIVHCGSQLTKLIENNIACRDLGESRVSGTWHTPMGSHGSQRH
ncbi:hypothetical protein FKM82_002882 [Ascaphus truei]